MKTSDYCRYRAELLRTGKLKFSTTRETAEFLSIWIMGDYRAYLERKLRMATDTVTRNDYVVRLSCEPGLVQNYVMYFLDEQLMASDQFGYKFLRKFFKSTLLIDTNTHSELYEYVLKKLNRTSDVSISDAFSNNRVFTIIEDLRLEMKTI